MIEDRIRAAAARVAALLEGAGTAAGQRMPDSEWTVADAAAHLVGGARLYTDIFNGIPSPLASVEEAADSNARMLSEYTQRDPAALARELKSSLEDLLVAYRSGAPERMLHWHAGMTVSAGDTAALILGELLVHGWDMARSIGKPWPIDPADAAEILTAALAVAPNYVDPAAAGNLTGVVEVRLRGQTRVALHWRDGKLSIGEAGGKADCIVSADPVAMLLQSYGRGSKWKPILTGKVISYGRKPLLALKMQGALRSP